MKRHTNNVGHYFASAATAGLIATYGLTSGAYDIVVRQEIALVLWWVLGLGAVVGLLPRRRLSAWAWAPVATLVLLGGWVAISLGWTESDERTVAEAARCVGYLGLLLLALFTLSRSTSRPAIGGALVASAGVCLLAVLDRLAGWELAGEAVLNRLGTSRMHYPFDYWNAVGIWAAMALVLALALSAHEKKAAVRAAALAVVPLAAMAAYLTYSRTAAACVALGMLLVLVFARRRWTTAANLLVAGAATSAVLLTVHSNDEIARGTGATGGFDVGLVLILACLACATAGVLISNSGIDRLRLPSRSGRLVSAAAALVVLIGATITLVSALPTLRDQFEETQSGSISSDDPAARLSNLSGTRRLHWESALEAFEAHPSQGVGAGSFEFWNNRNVETPEFVRDAHSIFLEALAELGWPGLVLVVVFLFSLLAMVVVSRMRAPPNADHTAGARTGAIAVVVILIVSAGVDWMWEATAVTALALIVASASGAGMSRGGSKPARGVRFALVPAALAACLVLLPGMVSTSLLRKSEDAVRDGDVQAGFAYAVDARESAPWAASPLIQQALIQELSGDYRRAQATMTLAVRREPTNFRPQLLLARIAAEAGDVATARSAYGRARRLRPHSPLFQLSPSASAPATRSPN